MLLAMVDDIRVILVKLKPLTTSGTSHHLQSLTKITEHPILHRQAFWGSR